MMTSGISTKKTIKQTKTKLKKKVIHLQNKSYFGKIYSELSFLAKQ